MAFAQAYYTSCEVGLSDFAGFQFNAATAGIAPQVLREVEALTSYEPPQSLGYHPTADQIASCPVNLVYRSEPTTILANVVYVGADASGRLGNYFAHALIADHGPGGFDRVLPIELWGSTFWAADPIPDRELPALADLPELRGPLNRAGVDQFLAGRRGSEQLTALVSAAQDAVLGRGRSIVVIESDTDAAAHWIGAIAFLLPPPLARRMSFATYHHRPEYSDTHVIATVPESDFTVDDAVAGSYIVFDPGSGRISDVAPDPAAALLVQAGTVSAERLFKRAARLLPGSAEELSQWHPALVAAAALEGAPMSEADLDLLSHWLESADVDLPNADRGALLVAILDQPACAPRHLNGLAGQARLGDDPALTLRIEQAVVEAELRSLTSPVDPVPARPGSGVTVLSPQGREFAVARGAEALRTAPGPTVVTVLDWCDQLGIELPETSLRACGEHTLGPELVRGDTEAALAAGARGGALLEGVLTHLSSVVAQHPEAVAHAFTAGLGELVDDAALSPELQQATAAARAQPEAADGAVESSLEQPGGRTPGSLRRLVGRINGRKR